MAIGLRPCRNSGSKPRPIRGWLGCPDPTQIAAITRWPQSTSADPEGPPWAGRDKFLPGRAGGGADPYGTKDQPQWDRDGQIFQMEGTDRREPKGGGEVSAQQVLLFVVFDINRARKRTQKTNKAQG